MMAYLKGSCLHLLLKLQKMFVSLKPQHCILSQNAFKYTDRLRVLPDSELERPKVLPSSRTMESTIDGQTPQQNLMLPSLRRVDEPPSILGSAIPPCLQSRSSQGLDVLRQLWDSLRSISKFSNQKISDSRPKG